MSQELVELVSQSTLQSFYMIIIVSNTCDVASERKMK